MPTKDSCGVDRTSTPSSASTPSMVVSAVGTVTPPDLAGSDTFARGAELLGRYGPSLSIVGGAKLLLGTSGPPPVPRTGAKLHQELAGTRDLKMLQGHHALAVAQKFRSKSPLKDIKPTKHKD